LRDQKKVVTVKMKYVLIDWDMAIYVLSVSQYATLNLKKAVTLKLRNKSHSYS
jgi:hypothetical protein